jgi:hypothetical protein
MRVPNRIHDVTAFFGGPVALPALYCILYARAMRIENTHRISLRNDSGPDIRRDMVACAVFLARGCAEREKDCAEMAQLVELPTQSAQPKCASQNGYEIAERGIWKNLPDSGVAGGT